MEPWIAHDNIASLTVAWCIYSAPFATGAQLYLEEGLLHPRVTDITFIYRNPEDSPGNPATIFGAQAAAPTPPYCLICKLAGKGTISGDEKHNLEVLVGLFNCGGQHD